MILRIPKNASEMAVRRITEYAEYQLHKDETIPDLFVDVVESRGDRVECEGLSAEAVSYMNSILDFWTPADEVAEELAEAIAEMMEE